MQTQFPQRRTLDDVIVPASEVPESFYVLEDKLDRWRYRRLVPDELDQPQGFPTGSTADGISDGHRAFRMGNALVVGIPHLIGAELAKRMLGHAQRPTSLPPMETGAHRSTRNVIQSSNLSYLTKL